MSKYQQNINSKKIIIATYGDVGISLLQVMFKNNFLKKNILVLTHYKMKNNERFISYLKHFGIKYILDNQNNKKIINVIKKSKCDLLLSFHYRKKISVDIINSPLYKSVNLHPSLLPKYAGCFSSVWAIFNGEKKTGITYHKMTNKFDDGNIILQKRLSIRKNDTAFSLFYKLLHLSFLHLNEVFDLIFNKKFEGVEQNKKKRSYYSRKMPNNGKINKNWTEEKKQRFYRCAYFPPINENYKFKIK